MAPTLSVERLTEEQVSAYLPEPARLCITMFRELPYWMKRIAS